MHALRLRHCGVVAAGLVAACTTAGPHPAREAERAGVRFEEVARKSRLLAPQSARRVGADCLLDPDRLRGTLPASALTELTGSTGDRCLPERMSGGVAVRDVDGDRDPDVYLTALDGPGRLYANDGHGRFTDVTAGSGLDELPAGSNGATWADVDNDGRPDLYVTMLATTRYFLFHNRDGRHFDEEAQSRGAALESDRVHTGFTPTFGDVDNDGWLDLYVTEWSSAEWSRPATRSDQRLLRNLGAVGRPGVFADETEARAVATESADLPVLGFAAGLVDLDADGRSDLVLASDYRTSRLFWNDGSRFLDGTRRSGLGTDENGMGLTIADYDGDRRPDVFVTSIFGTRRPCATGYCGYGISGNRLYRNNGDRTFTDVTDRAGVRDGGWGWGAAFVDGANRGRMDLVMASGVAFPAQPLTARYRDGSLRYWSLGSSGRYREVAAAVGLRARGPGKGVAVFDADGDGRTDVLVVRDGATPSLYRNVTPRVGHWLEVEVVGRRSNRDGLGAIVTVRAAGARSTSAAVGSVTGFLGQSPNTVHAGLGDATRAHVTVSFPTSGATVTVPVSRVDRSVTVREPLS